MIFGGSSAGCAANRDRMFAVISASPARPLNPRVLRASYTIQAGSTAICAITKIAVINDHRIMLRSPTRRVANEALEPPTGPGRIKFHNAP